MNEEHIQKILDDVDKEKIKGKENAKKIEQKLEEISDYLDSFFGPPTEESVKEFEKYIKELKKS